MPRKYSRISSWPRDHDRNIAIVLDVANGLPSAELKEKYKISSMRVHQIYVKFLIKLCEQVCRKDITTIITDYSKEHVDV